MKKTFSLILFLLSQFSFAQINLVPNPSFEDTVSCPNSGGQVWKAKFWQTVANSPDYFHVCNPFWQYGIPYNTFGYQWPTTGVAYMGLWEYSLSAPLYREIIGADIITPLTIGQKYFINVNVNVAHNSLSGTNAATNKLGVLLSTFNYLSNSYPITNWCQVFADTIIADSINWTPIRGSFVADSAYTFISLGNFFSNTNIDTVHLNPSNTHQAYYYIDDVCLSTDSMYCELWTGLPEGVKKRNILIYPNPAYNNLTIENVPYGCNKIELIDTQGKCIISLDNKSRRFKISINISSIAEGIYSIILKNENSLLIKKFIKSN